MKTLYTLFLRLLLPFVLARLWWRGRAEPLYREAVGERFGHYDSDRPEKLIWIHAVSVGEKGGRRRHAVFMARARIFGSARVVTPSLRWCEIPPGGTPRDRAAWLRQYRASLSSTTRRPTFEILPGAAAQFVIR